MSDPFTPLPPATQAEQTLGPNQSLRFEMSPGIGKLVGALAKARKQFTPVLKNAENPFFKSKYADLADVIDATKDGLSAHGLAVLQLPSWESVSGITVVTTLLAHESGEWVKSVLELPTSKRDAQGIGSATTYARRYSYSAILNVASESDDDANAAVSKDFKKKGAKEESEEDFDQRTIDQQCISAFQVAKIADACKRSGKTDAEVEAYLGLIGHKQVKDLLKSEFTEFLKWAETKSAPKMPAGLKPASQIESPAQKAMKRVFATANEHRIPEADVKTFCYGHFGVKSMTELTVIQLDEAIKWIKEVSANVAES